jgi:nicotinate-nucleotide adenylyltransferase
MTSSDRRQRIGLLGGTFDPIHIGHLFIAEQCREQLQLDEVRFIPAAVSPLKLEHNSVDGKHRLEMVRLAVGGNAEFTVDERELRRGGTSFTVDTLREMAQELPDSRLFLILGADSLADLDRWREPEEICRLAYVVIVARGGHAAPEMQRLARYLPTDQQAQVDQHLLKVPQIEISSTDLRRRIAEGRSTRYQLHPAVEAYIAAHELYL